jgi:glycosyltransferase involved in cell wall biosynthesis/sugar phosphate isomerase/epimerase
MPMARLFRLVLVPCLIADPAWASVPSSPLIPASPRFDFGREALSSIPGFVPSGFPRTQARIKRTAHPSEPVPEYPPFLRDLIRYDDRSRQFVDFNSRLGIWGSHQFGIAGADIASQREGKQFMNPLLRLQLRDVETNRILDAPATLTSYPWGYTQDADFEGVRLQLTVVFAGLDVVALKARVTNLLFTPRKLQWITSGSPLDTGRPGNRSQIENDTLVIEQLSPPASGNQLRFEPNFAIATAIHPSFSLGQHEPVDHGSYYLGSEPFVLESQRSETVAIGASVAAIDGDAAEEAKRLAAQRLNAIRPLDIDQVIRDAKRRWKERLRTIPAEGVEPRYQPLLQQCVMILEGKNTIRPQPEVGYGSLMGPHWGTFPSRPGYEAFWIWDAAFQAVGLAEWNLPLAKENIRLALRNQNPDGGLRMVHPDSSIDSSQPPLLAWAALHIYEKEKAVNPGAALAFLREVYPKLARWHRWWDQRRDPNGDGLYSWSDNLASGRDDAPDWDTFDGKAGYQNDFGSTRYAAVDLNSYLLKDLRVLGRLAEALGRRRDAQTWQRQADSLGRRIVDHLYDADRALFYSADDRTGDFRRVLTPVSFLPLWAGVPLSDPLARRMIDQVLLNPRDLLGAIPFPSVAYSDSHYDASGAPGYWRGPTWINLSYLMLELLSRYGYHQEAEAARQRLLDMAVAHGIHENYDSQSGRPGAHNKPDFGWSAALLVPIARRSYTSTPSTLIPEPVSPAPVSLWIENTNLEIFGRSLPLRVRVANRTGAAIAGRLEIAELPWHWTAEWEGGNDFNVMPTGRESDTVTLRLFPRAHRQLTPYPVRVRARSVSGEQLLGESTFWVRPAAIPDPWDLSGLDTLPWAELKKMLESLPRFIFRLEGHALDSGRGLEATLRMRDALRGTKAVTLHIAELDFIKHLAAAFPENHPVRRTLRQILDSHQTPQEKDREAQRYMHFLLQYVYDREHAAPGRGWPSGGTLGLIGLGLAATLAAALGHPAIALALSLPIGMALHIPPAQLPVVGIVHNSIYVAGGGVNTVMKQQIDGLIAAGFKVQIFVRDPDEYKPDNPRIEVVPLRGGRDLLEEMRERMNSADVFLIHNMLTTDIDTHMRDSLRQLIAEWKDKKRFIAWTHDIFNISHLPQRGQIEGVQYVAISEPRRDLIADYLGTSRDQFKVIPNSWHLRGYLGLSDEVNWLWQHYNLYSADYVAFYPVRLAANKHVHRAIDIVGAMNQLGKKTYLLLPGPHDQWEEDNYKEFKAQAASLGIPDKILFLADVRSDEGRPLILSDKMMSDIYQLSSLVLATSVDEGFGQFGPEAGFRGVPVAALPIPAIEYALKWTSYFKILDGDPMTVASDLIPYLEQRVDLKRSVFQRFNFDLNLVRDWLPLLGLPALENEPYRIGCQTSVTYKDLPRIEDQFVMAFHNGLNSFEIFFERGFVPSHIQPALRAWFKAQAAEKDMVLQVRAPRADPASPDDMQRLWDSLDFARDVGSNMLILEVVQKNMAAAAVGFAPIIENARQQGIRVAFQNGHYGENGRTIYHTAEDINTLVGILNSQYGDSVGASVALSPAQLSQGAAEFLRQVRVPLFNVQLSDNNGKNEEHLRFGAGTVQVDEVVDELVKRWYKGPMNFAYFFGNIARDRFELEEKFLSRISSLRRRPRLGRLALVAAAIGLGAHSFAAQPNGIEVLAAIAAIPPALLRPILNWIAPYPARSVTHVRQNLLAAA